MKNFIQEGERIQIPIPAGGCSPTMPLLIGNDLIAIPQNTFDAGTEGNVTAHLCGVWGDLPLHSGDTPAVGDKLYWDDSESELTTTSSGNVLAGWAMNDATSGDVTISLKLKC